MKLKEQRTVSRSSVGSQTEDNDETTVESKKEKQEIRSEYREALKNMRQLQSEIKRIDVKLVESQSGEDSVGVKEQKVSYSDELERLCELAKKSEEEKVGYLCNQGTSKKIKTSKISFRFRKF